MYSYITFLTDFGLQDDFVGVCHGVIARVAPDVSVLDITHGIPPQAILQGAAILANTVPYMPKAVHLAVIDPEVGGERRAIAIRTRDGCTFVGPDNGLLIPAATAAGIEAAHELTDERYRLERVSRTFHARDVFAPAAAHLAPGGGLAELGAHVDGIGLERGDRVELALELEAYYAVVADTFADAATGELILFEDSYGAYAIAISGGDASALTTAGPGDAIRISPAA